MSLHSPVPTDEGGDWSIPMLLKYFFIRCGAYLMVL